MSDPQRRTSPRFALRYRAYVEYSLDGTECRLECATKNVSLGGVLIESPALIPLNSLLEFVITAAGERMIRQIEFMGTGEVVRVLPDPPGSGFVIAIKCTHPIEFHRVEVDDNTKTTLTTLNSKLRPSVAEPIRKNSAHPRT
jgi:hypothetical protein